MEAHVLWRKPQTFYRLALQHVHNMVKLLINNLFVNIIVTKPIRIPHFQTPLFDFENLASKFVG